jgi:RHS repeat-associated protein
MYNLNKSRIDQTLLVWLFIKNQMNRLSMRNSFTLGTPKPLFQLLKLSIALALMVISEFSYSQCTTVFNVTSTGATAICPSATGPNINLNNSLTGIRYQLKRDGINVGAFRNGNTGTAINWTNNNVAGTYTVDATKTAAPTCTIAMSGSVTVTINPLPAVFAVSGGSYCTGGTGASVNLGGSELGVNYQLRRGTTVLVGAPIPGTGSTLTWPNNITAATNYNVVATNAITGCTVPMSGNGTVTINPLPGLFNVTGTTTVCATANVTISLSGSAAGISYQLRLNGSDQGSPIVSAGTGVLTWPGQTVAGAYTVVATNTTTNCTRPMNGTATITINTPPTVFVVSGGGAFCAGGTGVPINLGGSTVGVNYQLRRGTVNVGAAIAGTGLQLSWPNNITAATNYNVVATNTANSCSLAMSGSATVTVNPLPALFNVTGTITICSGASTTISLSGSAVGINYQLRLSGVDQGTPIAGTGVSALTWPGQTAAGAYTVMATDATSSCSRLMTGTATVTVNPLPSLLAMTGVNNFCGTGTLTLGINNSQSGTSYRLRRDGVNVGAAINGTGIQITFPNQIIQGVYTILATRGTCTLLMTGSASINPLPSVATVGGGGSVCAGGTGVPITLSASQVGVNYQLKLSGINQGAPVAGTGALLNLGNQTTIGNYTVVATNPTTTCTLAMTGSATITVASLPQLFSVLGGGPSINGAGVSIQLNGSQLNTNYQLQLNGVNTGTPIAGTNGPLTWAGQTQEGTYTVLATSTGGCVQLMTGNASITNGLVADQVEFNLLKKFYDSLGGPNWTTKTNWPAPGTWPTTATAAQMGAWYGVGVTDGDVSAIGMLGNNLVGKFPSNMGDIQQLTNFQVYANAGITGTIPSSFGSLSKLQYLILQSNNLSGQIPSSLGNLTNLKSLLLSYNHQLSGTIPVELGNLSNLEQLNLDENQFNGNIPSSLGNLSKLTGLTMSFNQLSGTIPPSLGNLALLTTLWLYGNQLSGSIPSELGNLNNLQSLILQSNQLTGQIPPSLGNLSNLKTLLLPYNQLSGPIPTELGNLSNLEQLGLDQNQLTGAIPSSIGNLLKLTTFSAGINQLTGTIPSSFGNLSLLTSITLYANQLSGNVPPSLVNLNSLQSLILQNNRFTSLPDFSQHPNRQNLTISIQENKISFESIEPNVGKLAAFSYSPQNSIDDLSTVSYTTINLVIPARPTGQYSTVVWEKQQPDGSWLNVNATNGDTTQKTFTKTNTSSSDAGVYRWSMTNSLATGLTLQSAPITTVNEGLVPDAIEYQALKDLFTSTNGANWINKTNWPTTWPASATAAEFGTWFGVNVANGDVTNIYIPTNNLVGTIPPSIGNLTSLNFLQLQNNQLSGAIPFELGNLSNLEQLKLDQNQISGSIPSSLGNLTKLQELTIPNNQLIGEMPISFGGLSSLTLLWLSGNQLSGGIPTSLGNLNNLQNLILQSNQLTGSIPSSLGNLTSLKGLLLGYNKLSGTIPSELGSLSNLVTLQVDENQLTGTIPSSIGNLSKLSVFSASGNQLNGTIPSSLGDLSLLTSLSLYANQLSGSVPSSLTGLSNLQSLILQTNKFVSLPDFSQNLNRQNLVVSITGNKISFESIEPNISQLSAFYYSPQNTIDDFSTISYTTSSLVIPARPTGQYSSVIWEKQQTDGSWLNVNSLNQNTSQKTFVRNAPTAQDAGVYRWSMTNTVATGMSLQSDPITLTFKEPNIDDLIKADSLRNNKIPQPIKITRDGLLPAPPIEGQYTLSELNQGDDKAVFPAPPCLTGNYYVGFQLYYDLGDKETTKNWLSQLTIALVHISDTLWTKPLQVNSKNQTFIETAFYDSLISCDGEYHFVVKQKLMAGQVPQSNVYLKVLLYKNNDAVFDIASPVTLNCNYNGSETTLSWNYTGPGVKEYDIEWVFIADHENFKGNTADSAFRFKEPVRVTTAAMHYSHLIYYQKGSLWYRTRAVGYSPQYPDHRIVGQWFYSPCASITVNNPEPTKNWQVQTVFAEEGKYKKVVHYFDGTLRTRQSQTNLSTENITLSGETLYDFEGRKSVEILAAPSEAQYNTTLTFKPGLNNFQSVDPLVATNTSAVRKKFNYDNQLAENSKLSNVDGAGRYYSTANTRSTMHSMLIPDGQGYVYSQTEYLNDGTGRVRRQSGVGEEFRMDGTHATRYFYGSAAPAELIRLFGTNVGNASHYKKNLVVDANGQVSVSYHDQSDRVIASALAGEKPTNVEPLLSYTNLDPNAITVDISSKNEKADGISVIAHKLLNSSPNTNYTFNYNLSALGSLITQIGCSACEFDLSITITDPDGKLLNLASVAGNESADGFSYERKNISAADCANPTQVNVAMDLVLADIGDYTITKTLRPTELSFETMKTLVSQNVDVQTKINEIRNSYPVDPTKCDICTSCPDAEAAINSTIDEVATLDCENIRQQIVQALRDHHLANNPTDFEYEPTQAEIQADTLYCKYTQCSKDKTSDIFEKQMARVANWPAAVSAGYNNSINSDPFFNNTSLSGSAYKAAMIAKLNSVFVATIKYDTNNDGTRDATSTYQGPIAQVTDPANTAYYINDNGAPDVNGRHVLYMELMGRKNSMSATAYNAELNSTRWNLFKGFYLEAKRKTKLEIPAYNTCAPAKRELERVGNLPTTEKGVTDLGNSSGITGPVGDSQLRMSFYSIQFNCGSKINKTDSTAIAGHLATYFNTNPKNFFRLILKPDLTSNADLIAINTILTTYGCGLASTAVDDPISCAKDTTIVIPAEFLPALAPQNATIVSLNESPQDGGAQLNAPLMKSSSLSRQALVADESDLSQQAADPSLVAQDSIGEKIRKRFMDDLQIAHQQKMDSIMKAVLDGHAKDNAAPLLAASSDKTDSIPQRDPVLDSLTTQLRLEAQKRHDEIVKEHKEKILASILNSDISVKDSVANKLIETKSFNQASVNTVTGIKNLQQDSIIQALVEKQFQKISDSISTQHRDKFLQSIIAKSSKVSPTQKNNKAARQVQTFQGASNATAAVPVLIPQSEYDALVTFYNATIGLNWTNNTGWSGNNGIGGTPDVTDWYGLGTDIMGDGLTHVVSINLPGNNLNGTIPNEVGNLTYLSLFALPNYGGSNFVSGDLSIFSPLLNLTYLHLDVYETSMTGDVSSLAGLTKLTDLILNLSGQVTGDISSFSSLRNLTLLVVSIAELTGDISSLSVLTNLNTLLLGDNHVSGDISSLGSLTNLTYLGLARMQLNGSIDSFSNLTQIQRLILDDVGYISGNLSSLSGLTNLLTFILRDANLSGDIGSLSIPNLRTLWLLNSGNLTGNLGSLSSLDLSSLYIIFNQQSQVSGDLSAFSNMSNLTSLGINHCPLTGNFSSLPNGLISLQISNSSISTDISSLANYQKLQFIIVLGNEMTGGFPNFQNANALRILDIRYNKFSGNILPNLLPATPLSLSIDGNKFTFTDFINILNVVPNGVSYTPQDSVDVNKTILVPAGGSVTLTSNIDRTTSPASLYQWFKKTATGSIAITPSPSASDYILAIGSATSTDSGDYYYQITNPAASFLTLTSRIQKLNVTASGTCQPDLQTEYNALMALYNSTNGAEWTNTVNNNKPWGAPFPTNVGNWYGVTTDAQGHVKSIDLNRNNLNGTIPVEISNLCLLQTLDLSWNSLQGTMPPQLNNLKELRLLNLSSNQLTGAIPLLDKLTRLGSLILSYNQLSGSIPSLANPGGLSILYLNNNQLTGAIPSLDNFVNLDFLAINNNQLSGSIPSLTNLGNLLTLYLHNNQLTGSIPSLDNLVNLTDLLLNDNQLSGSIPSLDKLTNIYQLSFGSNQLTGTIPSLDKLTKLSYFGVFNNQLSGSIPPLDKLTKITNLFLSHNQLSGSIPPINNLAKVINMNLSSNQLSGSIPTEIAAVLGLSIGTNKFIFSDILPIKQITQAFFSYSPQDSVDVKKTINIATAGSTTLNASIDRTTTPPSSYQWFKNNVPIPGATSYDYVIQNATAADAGAYYYQITNPDATALTLTSRIQTVNVGTSVCQPNLQAQYDALMALYNSTGGAEWTNRTGWGTPFPTNVGTWYGVTANGQGFVTSIAMQSNNLNGTLPSQLSNICSLQTLILSYNQISGNIPIEFNQMKFLQYIDLGSNMLTGLVPSFSGVLQLQYVNLQQNKLSGVVPPSLGTIRSLFYLDLKANNFLISDFIGVSKTWNNIRSFPASNGLIIYPQPVPGLITQDTLRVGQSISYSIDYNDPSANPPNIFKWFKAEPFSDIYYDFFNDEVKEYPIFGAPKVLSPLGNTANNGRTLVLNNVAVEDEAQYFYTITNPDVKNFGLVDLRHFLTVKPNTGRTITTCLAYDTANVTLKNFSFKADFNELIARCMANAAKEDSILMDFAIDKFIEEEVTNYYNTFRTNCQQLANERLTYSYVPKEFHYTLYYYDQAGNLVQTVPPQGVKPLTAAQVNAYPGTKVNPAHELITLYQYNSLNQLLYQKTPDAGESRFWYNDKSQLKLSQNARQLIDKNYSYTKYDEQGRITEVGEMATTNVLDTLVNRLENQDFPSAASYALTDITRTHYDFGNNLIQPTFYQQQLRNRVAWVEVMDKASLVPNISYQPIYKNDGSSLSGVINIAGSGATAIQESINGESYIKVENICPGLCERAGVAFNARPMTVIPGESYLIRAKGYHLGSGPVQFELQGNGSQGLVFLTYSDKSLPLGAAVEGWIEQAVSIPSGVTSLYVTLLWKSPALGQVYYLNEIQIIKKISDSNNQLATYYSYDIHGNVRSLLQQVPGLANKRTDYVYDLVSGKVNFVMYQYGEQDQFIHRYEYDADNRIVDVLSSTDGFLWDKEAAYQYYLHGPLARTELGEYRVQGSDYYYTLQGWLKGVNSPTGVSAQANDPGKDGFTTSTVGRDVYAYNLGYYQGDYKPAGGLNSTLIENSSPLLWRGVGGEANSLFNGNIAWMATDLSAIASAKADRNAGVQAMQYNYDQLHRIVRSRSLGGYDPNRDDNSFASRTIAPAAYDEDYTYDANGNILTLQRRNELAALQDDFNYIYYKGTNRLRSVLPPTQVDTIYTGAVNSNRKIYRNIIVQDNAYVTDGADVTLHAEENVFLHPQFNKANGKSFRAYAGADGPYQYDAIGNLVADETEGVKISWTPYGKVREVKTKNDSIVVSYRYDAAGNRVEKRVRSLFTKAVSLSSAEGRGEVVTNYLRDASGNVMAIYKTPLSEGEGAGGEALLEQPLYGSSRLGMYKGGRKEGQRILGKKNYELTNHLGNVLSVITDNAGMKPDSVWATVVSATDYYPFGLEMKGRTYSNDKYRYGFNGMEKDKEFNETYTTEFRQYDPRIGRWLSVDPLTRKFPDQSPYTAFNNNPIFYIDPTGLKPSNNGPGDKPDKIINVFVAKTKTNRDDALEASYKEAKKFEGLGLGLKVLEVESISDLNGQLSKLKEDGYTINNLIIDSHGKYDNAKFEIGDDVVKHGTGNNLKKISSFLVEGKSMVVLLACHSGGNGINGGEEMIQNLSTTLNTTVYASRSWTGVVGLFAGANPSQPNPDRGFKEQPLAWDYLGQWNKSTRGSDPVTLKNGISISPSGSVHESSFSVQPGATKAYKKVYEYLDSKYQDIKKRFDF